MVFFVIIFEREDRTLTYSNYNPLSYSHHLSELANQPKRFQEQVTCGVGVFTLPKFISLVKMPTRTQGTIN